MSRHGIHLPRRLGGSLRVFNGKSKAHNQSVQLVAIWREMRLRAWSMLLRSFTLPFRKADRLRPPGRWRLLLWSMFPTHFPFPVLVTDWHLPTVVWFSTTAYVQCPPVPLFQPQTGGTPSRSPHTLLHLASMTSLILVPHNPLLMSIPATFLLRRRTNTRTMIP